MIVSTTGYFSSMRKYVFQPRLIKLISTNNHSKKFCLSAYKNHRKKSPDLYNKFLKLLLKKRDTHCRNASTILWLDWPIYCKKSAWKDGQSDTIIISLIDTHIDCVISNNLLQRFCINATCANNFQREHHHNSERPSFRIEALLLELAIVMFNDQIWIDRHFATFIYLSYPLPTSSQYTPGDVIILLVPHMWEQLGLLYSVNVNLLNQLSVILLSANSFAEWNQFELHH